MIACLSCDPGWSVRYLLNGDGKWMSKWHCTDGDALLAAVWVSATLIMAYEYFVFYLANRRAVWIVQNASFREYHERLARVFLECALIHVLNSVVAYLTTPYMFICGLTVHNAFMARRLNGTELARRSCEAFVRSELESGRLDLAREVLRSPGVGKKTVTELADELRAIMRDPDL